MGTRYNRLGKAVLMGTQNQWFEQNYKNFVVKFSDFAATKNLCILHRHVFVMCFQVVHVLTKS